MLPFSPGYAAYTFPMAIGATALFKTVGLLEAWPIRQKLIDQLHGLAVFKLLVATAVIAYVIARFGQFAWTHWWKSPGGVPRRLGPREASSASGSPVRNVANATSPGS